MDCINLLFHTEQPLAAWVVSLESVWMFGGKEKEAEAGHQKLL